MAAHPGAALAIRQDRAVLAQDFDIAYAGKALAQVRAAVEGNGLDPAQVLLGTVDGSLLIFQGRIRFRLVLKTTESDTAPLKLASGEQSQTVRSRGDLESEIRTYTTRLMEDPGIGARLTGVLMERTDKGFGLGGSEIPTGLPARHFVIQETCPTCRGGMKVACGRCHATGRLPCPNCRGTKMAMCPACKARKYKDTPQGKVPCPVCHARGQVTCRPCKATGTMPCGTCHTTGKVSCTVCAGTGHKTHRTTVEVMMAANSDFDISGLPAPAARIIEKIGGKFMAQGHAVLEAGAVQPDGEKGAYVIPCTFRLPYAEVGLAFPGHKYQAVVFGEKARIVDMPPFLDRMLGGAVRRLQEAARGGSAYGALKQAAQAKAIRVAIVAAAQYTEPKAVAELRRVYPVGLSALAAQKIIHLLAVSLNRVTLGPALIGMTGGLVAAGALYATLFSPGVRAALASAFPGSGMTAADLLTFVAGGFLTVLGGAFNARRAVRAILGRESGQSDGARKLVVRRLWITVGGWVLSAAVFVGVAFAMFNGAESVPGWFAALRGVLGI
ncbi:MAG TPA: hypothetical protein PKX87_04145 [Alphaproteobacteria bacterium]|nr:hypothetical protein [Alphaproteobacteria bacterium]